MLSGFKIPTKMPTKCQKMRKTVIMYICTKIYQTNFLCHVVSFLWKLISWAHFWSIWPILEVVCPISIIFIVENLTYFCLRKIPDKISQQSDSLKKSDSLIKSICLGRERRWEVVHPSIPACNAKKLKLLEIIADSDIQKAVLWYWLPVYIQSE